MNEHDEIKALLPAYAGGDLSAGERLRIENHLASCNACRGELGDLEVVLRLVRSEPEVDPPPWMSVRIMAQVREISQASQQGWLSRLFRPLSLKLPLEALALVFLCVTGYYLAQDTERQISQPLSTPKLDSGRPAEPGPDLPAPAARIQTPAAVPAPPSSTVAPSGPPSQPAKSAAPVQIPLPAAEEKEYHTAPAPQTAAPAPPAAPPVPRKQETITPATESMERNRSGFAPAMKAAPQLPPSAAESKKAKSVSRDAMSSDSAAGASSSAAHSNCLKVAMYSNDPQRSGMLIREAVERSGGSLVSPPAASQMAIRIPAVSFPELLSRLAPLGRITERPLFEERAGMLEMTICW